MKRRILFASVFTLLGIVPALAEPALKKTVGGAFEVTIAKRRIPGELPIALMGDITIQIYDDGSISGKVTRGTLPDGSPLPSVLFEGSPYSPVMNAPETINFTGTLHGRIIGFTFELPAGPDGAPRRITGVGVTNANLLDDAVERVDYDFAQGSAVGPRPGDSGDWGSFLSTRPTVEPRRTTTTTTTRCTSVYNPDGTLHCMVCETITVTQN
jgi:hypothetical protein